MVKPGRLKIYENGEWRYVGYGPASSVATDLSDVTIDADKDWNGKSITNIGTINGVDIDASINQAVTTTSSPTFAAITVTGNVDGVDISAFKSDYDAKVNQDVRSTASPTFVVVKASTLIIGNASASDTLQFSNDTQKATAATTYTKVKSTKMNVNLTGTIRVKYKLESRIGGGTANGKIYLNGSAIGTERTDNGAGTVFSEDFTLSLSPGDTIEIYAKANSGNDAYVKDFRIYYTISAATGIGTANDP